MSDERGFFRYAWHVMRLRVPPGAGEGTSRTPYATRKLAQRARIAMILGKLRHRDVILRFHHSDSCGGHMLPADVFANMPRCPDETRDLRGHRRNLWEGGQQ